jgi:hypothetical protein
VTLFPYTDLLFVAHEINGNKENVKHFFTKRKIQYSIQEQVKSREKSGIRVNIDFNNSAFSTVTKISGLK